MIAKILRYISDFFTNAFSVVLDFLSRLFGGLFQGLINVLKAIFKPIFIVISIVFYFVYKLGELVVTLVTVIVAVGKLVYSFIVGIFNTIKSLSWTNVDTSSHGSWSNTFQNIFEALELFQLDKLAYVIMFVSWILTALAATRILSNRGSGEDV